MASAAEQKSATEKYRSHGRHRHPRSLTFASIHKLRAESLIRNSASLVINLALSAGCGYVGLTLLTRLFSVQAVGLSATAASASALVVFIMQFGINYSLPRFLPMSRNRTALINTMLTIIILATLLGAAAYLALPVAVRLFALGGWMFTVVFITGACAQAGEAALQTVLIADRSSSAVARANIIPNIIKLGAPPVFLFLGTLGAYVARVVSDVAGFIVLGVVVAKRGHRFRPAVSIASIRHLGRFSVGMYVAVLIGSLPVLVVPIIILSRFGSKQAAYWSIAIVIASLLYQLPGSVALALLPEVASRPSDRRYLLRRSAALILMLVTPALIVVYIAAPLLLTLFGHNYVAGSLATLRWLVIAGLVTILNYVTGAILFLAKKTLFITVTNVVDAVIVLGMATIWARSIDDVAIGWVIGDIANTVLFAMLAFFALHQVGGRWEALGDGLGQVTLTAAESRDSAMESQRRGIEALLVLAEAQRAGPWQGSRLPPMLRVQDSVDADDKE